MATGAWDGAPTATFGELLRYLRRRARLTQRDLGLAVGYSEAQISRLEQHRRAPDPTVVAALFLPALRLGGEPALARRLVALARHAARHRGTAPAAEAPAAEDLVEVPPQPHHAVSRGEALARLGALLDTERCVVVSGLAGVGKTTLAAALVRERAARQPVCWLTLTGGVTTSVEVVLRRLAAFLLRHGHPGVEPVLHPNLEQPLPLDERLRLLGEAMAADPVLVCLDNAQVLADLPDLVTALTHLTAGTAVHLLLPSRVQLRLPGAAAFRLGGLSVPQGRELVEAFGGLPGVLAAALIDRTGGNPMLLRLALSQLRAGHDPVRLVERLETRPEVAGYLLDTTLGGLSEPARRLLGLIAVFRGPVDLFDPTLAELAQRLDGPYDPLAAMTELHHRQLLEQPATAAVHPLVRDRVRAELATDPRRRRRLHRVAAGWYEHAAGDIAEAAWHRLQAGEYRRAGELLVERHPEVIDRGRAGHACAVLDELLTRVAAPSAPLLATRGDLLAQTERAAEAEGAYRAALGQAASAEERQQVAWRFSEYLLLRGRAEEALRMCRAVPDADRGTDPLLAARLGAAESRAMMACSQYEEAVRAGRRALARLSPTAATGTRAAAEVTVRVHAATGLAYQRTGDPDLAVAHLRSAVATARAAELWTLCGRQLLNLGVVQLDTGRLDEAQAHCDEAETMARATGDLHCLSKVLHTSGVVRYFRGDAAGAVALLAEALATKRRLGNPEALTISQQSMALALLALGRVAEAETMVGDALAGTAGASDGWRHAHALDALAMIRMVADGGLTPAVRAPLEQARDRLAAIGGDPHLAAMIAVHTALAALASGRPGEAARLLSGIAPREEDVLAAEAHFVRGALALRRGDLPAAATCVDLVHRHVKATGHALYSPAAHRLRAALARAPDPGDLPRMLWVTAHCGP
jgi:tetratricopeptide (TPR) repeat protein